jgi:5-methylthioribose kinase
MSIREQSRQRWPDFPWLGVETQTEIQEVLRRAGMNDGAHRIVQVAIAGQGNMNLTLRVTFDATPSPPQETLIIKQSRPWVEKYDVIEAPWDRALVEAAFYERIAAAPTARSRMPRLLGVDQASRSIILQDLGSNADLTSVYAQGELAADVVPLLADYLAQLHRDTRGTTPGVLVNREMRALNHAHIFRLPLQMPDRDKLNAIQPRLGDSACTLAQDSDYVRAVDRLGQRYLSDGPCLLHGDFFPGSWLHAQGRLYVIDPEFGFFGDPEFDVAVAVAHFALAGVPLAVAEQFVGAYGTGLDAPLVGGYAAVEGMRRLIGVAQLPLPATCDRVKLLAASANALRTSDWRNLWR